MEALTRHASNLGFGVSRAMKNARVIAKTVSDLGAGGLKSPTLDKMMERTTGLVRRPAGGGHGGRTE